MFLVAGAGVDVLVLTVVLPLVLPTAQSVEATAVFANRELSPRLSPNPVQVWPAFFQLYIYTKLNGEKIVYMMHYTRFNQHKGKGIYMICIWVRFV